MGRDARAMGRTDPSCCSARHHSSSSTVRVLYSYLNHGTTFLPCRETSAEKQRRSQLLLLLLPPPRSSLSLTPSELPFPYSFFPSSPSPSSLTFDPLSFLAYVPSFTCPPFSSLSSLVGGFCTVRHSVGLSDFNPPPPPSFRP